MCYFGQQSCLDSADKHGLFSLEARNSRIVEEGYEPIGPKGKQEGERWMDRWQSTGGQEDMRSVVSCIKFCLMLHQSFGSFFFFTGWNEKEEGRTNGVLLIACWAYWSLSGVNSKKGGCAHPPIPCRLPNILFPVSPNNQKPLSPRVGGRCFFFFCLFIHSYSYNKRAFLIDILFLHHPLVSNFLSGRIGIQMDQVGHGRGWMDECVRMYKNTHTSWIMDMQFALFSSPSSVLRSLPSFLLVPLLRLFCSASAFLLWLVFFCFSPLYYLFGRWVCLTCFPYSWILFLNLCFPYTQCSRVSGSFFFVISVVSWGEYE